VGYLAPLALLSIGLILQFLAGTASRIVLAAASAVVAIAASVFAVWFAREADDSVSECAPLDEGTAQALWGLGAVAFAATAGLALFMLYSAAKGRSPVKPLFGEIGGLVVAMACLTWLAGGTSC
jgi:hypothetical protein